MENTASHNRLFDNSLFELGQLHFTPGALDLLREAHGQRAHVEIFNLVYRHNTGDWGDIHPGDRGANEQSLTDGSRILSVYRLKNPLAEPVGRVWIITEADRSATTFLLPSEY